MRSIDIHAHLTPQRFWRATEDGGDWHTLRREQDANGRPVLVSRSARGQLPPKASWTPEQRLADNGGSGVLHLGRQLDELFSTGSSRSRCSWR